MKQSVLYFWKRAFCYAICTCFIISIPLFPKDLCAGENDKFSPFLEIFPIGNIDWDNGYIYGMGRGYLSVNNGSRPKAKRTAKVVAQSNIVKLAAGVRLDDRQTLEALGKERVVIKVSALVHFSEYRTVLVDNTANPYYEVTLRAPLNGVQGLTSNLLNKLKTIPDWRGLPSKPYAPASDDSAHPWLVLDVRGLQNQGQVRPALFPKVVTPSGETVYTVSGVNEEALTKRGMARYVVSDVPGDQLVSGTENLQRLFDAAGILSPVRSAFAEEKKQKRGNFIVKDVKQIQGLSQTNLVVSENDALQLKEEDKATDILKQCRVIIVVSSPIGGIEGKNSSWMAQFLETDDLL